MSKWTFLGGPHVNFFWKVSIFNPPRPLASTFLACSWINFAHSGTKVVPKWYQNGPVTSPSQFLLSLPNIDPLK